MILTHEEIHEFVRTGGVRYSKPEAVNGTSLDLHLGALLLVEAHPPTPGGLFEIDLSARETLNFREVNLEEAGSFALLPGQFMLAHTIEEFHLPRTISGEYLLKSSHARSGLEHLNARWCDPGWYGSTLTLELTNMTQYHGLRLRYGMPIGQMVFHRHRRVPHKASYAVRGRYNNDKSAQAIKP